MNVRQLLHKEGVSMSGESFSSGPNSPDRESFPSSSEQRRAGSENVLSLPGETWFCGQESNEEFHYRRKIGAASIDDAISTYKRHSSMSNVGAADRP